MLVVADIGTVCPLQSVARFRSMVAARLGEPWAVEVTAYDDESPEDLRSISAEVLASIDGLSVRIARHAGCDTVLVLHRDSPPVPVEDVLVALGRVPLEEILNHVRPGAEEIKVKPPVPLPQTLDVLREECRQLIRKFRDAEFRKHLRDLSDRIAHEAGLFEGSPPSHDGTG